MKHQIDCIGFKPLRKGTLVGLADIVIPELKLTIHDVGLHEKGSTRWASPPSRPWIRDGTVVTDGEGKVQYNQIIEFNDRRTRDALLAGGLARRARLRAGYGVMTPRDIFNLSSEDLDRWLADSGRLVRRRRRSLAAKRPRR